MRTLETLRRELHRLDGRGYPGYRSLQGTWDLGTARLHVDHVQSDPYAPASKVRVEIDRATTGLPAELIAGAPQRVALCDYLLRRFHEALGGGAGGRSTGGKGGGLRVMAPGQQILERTGVVIGEHGLEVRFEAALPANGRRIRGAAAAALLTEAIPAAVHSSLLARSLDLAALRRHVQLYLDQLALQEQLAGRGLVAFVGEAAVLPRAAGDSQRPMTRGARPLRCPEGLRVLFELPSGRTVSGMGIPEGITLIVGGGYHGKSTLLAALERGVHPHIAGDGREWVLTRADAASIRAEEGRSVSGVDLSTFLADLPSGADTRCFATADASGSTSQAAGVLEALEAGASTLLLDEDTSAANFMHRDARMRALIPADREPITPFAERVRALHRRRGVSTVLVAGGSGAFFETADLVLAMESYQPRDVTAEARRIAARDPAPPVEPETEEGADPFAAIGRRVLPAGALGAGSARSRSSRSSGSSRARGLRIIRRPGGDIDLAAVSQLMETGQTQAIALALDLLGRHLDGRRTVAEAVERVLETIERDGLDGLSPFSGHPGDLAMPRRAELHAALNRCRELPGAAGADD